MERFGNIDDSSSNAGEKEIVELDVIGKGFHVMRSVRQLNEVHDVEESRCSQRCGPFLIAAYVSKEHTGDAEDLDIGD